MHLSTPPVTALAPRPIVLLTEQTPIGFLTPTADVVTARTGDSPAWIRHTGDGQTEAFPYDADGLTTALAGPDRIPGIAEALDAVRDRRDSGRVAVPVGLVLRRAFDTAPLNESPVVAGWVTGLEQLRDQGLFRDGRIDMTWHQNPGFLVLSQ